MPEDSSTNTPQESGTRSRGTAAPSAPTVGGISGFGSGAETALASTGSRASAMMRAGGVTLDVGTDVTSDLDAALPALGNVIAAIGNGVANSQQALDNSVITTVNTLSNTKIKVVTQVIEQLGDDGLPDISKTELITQDLSVLNFFTPTVHEWKNVSISMDMSVGSFHQDQGLTFNRKQTKGSVGGVGLFWGFVGWFDTEESTDQTMGNRKSSQEVNWKQGQVRVDALLGPRQTGKFPVPASISIGPQIYISQGSVVEEVAGGIVTARSMDLEIAVRKSSGAANPSVPIALDAGGLLPSFTSGSSTDAQGKVKVTLKRALTPGFTGFRTFQLTASLGSIRKPFTITL